MRKLTDKEKAQLFFKIDHEGGLMDAIQHGWILNLVEGTSLEEPFQKLKEAYDLASELYGAENCEEVALEFDEDDL